MTSRNNFSLIVTGLSLGIPFWAWQMNTPASATVTLRRDNTELASLVSTWARESGNNKNIILTAEFYETTTAHLATNNIYYHYYCSNIWRIYVFVSMFSIINFPILECIIPAVPVNTCYPWLCCLYVGVFHTFFLFLMKPRVGVTKHCYIQGVCW